MTSEAMKAKSSVVARWPDAFESSIRGTVWTSLSSCTDRVSAEHVWVPNAVSDTQGEVCRNCGLVGEAFDKRAPQPCKPHHTFRGIPGFPPKCVPRSLQGELPALDVTEEDGERAERWLERGDVQGYQWRRMAWAQKRELICRERQLRAATQEIAELKAKIERMTSRPRDAKGRIVRKESND